jgi:hypothetical protein
MSPLSRISFASLVLVLASSASAAGNCEALQSQIDAKIREAGVVRFTLTTVDAAQPASGKVVGTCDLGTKKIIYEQQAGSDGAPAQGRPRGEPILTECKDGSVSVGGDCRK